MQLAVAQGCNCTFIILTYIPLLSPFTRSLSEFSSQNITNA